MERRDFFQHYRICTVEDGSLHLLSRTGPAANYKAVDTRTGNHVVLQLIARGTIEQMIGEQFEERVQRVAKIDHANVARVLGIEHDDEYFGLVSEFVEGETAESWVMTHGPMSADAVLRIGLQVVRALGAAAYHALSHRAIAPANILIVHGQTADGGWPFVKLANFGLAGLAIYDDKIDNKTLGPVPAPQFASPEQLVGKQIDFRSEIYSLGATMCFLLTGAVPLAVGGTKARLRARRLPELRRAPRALRNLLVHMLRENPDNRPQDPVLFEKEIQNCLDAVEKRQALGRKLGFPLAAVIPRKPRSTVARSTSSLPVSSQVWRGVLAFAVLLLLGGIVAAFLIPSDALPFHHREAKNIGVPVGVPPAVAEASATQPPPAPATTPVAVAQNANTNPPPAPSASAPPAIAQNENAEPPAPAQGPADNSSNAVAESSNNSQQASPSSPNESNNDEEEAKPKPVKKTASVSTSTARRSRTRSEEDEPASSHGRVHARYVGSTPDGRMILRLPSGRTVAVRPGQPDEDVDLSSHPRRRAYVPRDPDVPYQPFDPDVPRD